MHLKDKLWKIATAFVVLFLVLNPEMIELGIFIHTIGLELFLMLLEAQVLVVFAWLYSKSIRQNLVYLKKICIYISKPCFWKNIKNIPLNIVYIMPSTAILMNLLVFAAIFSFAINISITS